MFGFSAGGSSRSSSRAPADDSLSESTLVRRSSRINVNVAPTALAVADNDAPEIRKYKKRFGSDVLCASLWGMKCIHKL